MTRPASNEKEPRDGSQWLSLGPAARFLGVSEVTLRHWADAGRIRSYRTVGSHRRFARADLLLLLREQQRPPRTDGLEDQTLQRVRRKLRSPRATQPGAELDEEARGRLRVLGRRLLELALRYHQEPRRRPTLREEARFVGGEYATETLRLYLSLTQALESFLYHRSVLIDTVRGLAPSEGSREELLDLWRDVTELTDLVQLALVDVYEKAPADAEEGGHHSGGTSV